MRVMVVEDETLVALLLEDMLSALGHEVVGTAMRLPQALELATTCNADLAILDINLAGLKSFPVADMLTRRGMPFVFATGYGRAGLEPPYDSEMVIKKPFGPRELETAISLAAA
jgi:CheY-like chemotaxis protein